MNPLLSDAQNRPLVRVNQVGYLPDGPKAATCIIDAKDPRPFEVTTGGGDVIFSGSSVPLGYDGSSGFLVHLLEFSSFRRPLQNLTLRIAGQVSHGFSVGGSGYGPLFRDALAFLHLQRSGFPISEDRYPGYGREAGHVGVAPNRGDTAVTGWKGEAARTLYPDWSFDRRIDVSGGWYDAGDHGKYVVSGGMSAAMLLSAFEHFGDRLPRDAADALLDEAMWQVDWLCRMQVPPGEQYAGMAFHRVHDDRWTELPMLPAADPAERVLHRPSTAAALNLAAVAAHASRLLAKRDQSRSRELLGIAERAYAAAEATPDLLAPDDGGAYGGGPYDDADVEDEFYWAAIELALSTGAASYDVDVRANGWNDRGIYFPQGFDCSDAAPFATLQLAMAGEGDLREGARERLVSAASRLSERHAQSPWGIPYFPTDGWDWGSNGRTSSTMRSSWLRPTA